MCSRPIILTIPYEIQQDLDIDEVSPDEEDRAAERFIRSAWHKGEFV